VKIYRIFAKTVLLFASLIVFIGVWVVVISSIYMRFFYPGYEVPGAGLWVCCCSLPLAVVCSHFVVRALFTSQEKLKRKNPTS